MFLVHVARESQIMKIVDKFIEKNVKRPEVQYIEHERVPMLQKRPLRKTICIIVVSIATASLVVHT